MISAGIFLSRAAPQLPRTAFGRPTLETPKTIPQKGDRFVGATDALNANNHGGGSSSRDLLSIVF